MLPYARTCIRGEKAHERGIRCTEIQERYEREREREGERGREREGERGMLYRLNAALGTNQA